MAEKILIVNDESAVADLLKIILEDKDYQTKIALNGEEGIRLAKNWHPDLILLDIVMPGRDGFSVCAQLKNSPSTSQIPVIFLSSLTDSKDKIKGLEIGGVDFINRVTDKGELLARVKTHLTLSSLTLQLRETNEKLTEKQKSLDEDLIAAATIQQTLLPKEALQIPSLNIAWRCEPCATVGGDIFNILIPDKEHIIAYMLDVSGHGVPSAMVTVSVAQQIQQQTLHRAENSNGLSPKRMIEMLNKEYPLERYNKFFTIFYLVLNLKTGLMRYCCAGHPPALLLRSKESYSLLSAAGTVIGIEEARYCEEVSQQLYPQDKLILYTDGITESQNDTGRLFGTQKFYSLMENHKNWPLPKLIEITFDALKDFSNNGLFGDDRSMMILEYNPQ